MGKRGGWRGKKRKGVQELKERLGDAQEIGTTREREEQVMKIKKRKKRIISQGRRRSNMDWNLQKPTQSNGGTCFSAVVLSSCMDGCSECMDNGVYLTGQHSESLPPTHSARNLVQQCDVVGI